MSIRPFVYKHLVHVAGINMHDWNVMKTTDEEIPITRTNETFPMISTSSKQNLKPLT